MTYTQTVTLGGNVEGRPATTENFWVYFKPKPVDDGLPDATDMTTTLATLNSELKIFLCDKDGKQLSTLPLTSTIMNVDPKHPLGDRDAGVAADFVCVGWNRPAGDFGFLATERCVAECGSGGGCPAGFAGECDRI